MKRASATLLGLLMALSMGGTASAVTYNLRAAPTTLTLPGTTQTIPVWGFALVSRDGVAGDNIPRVPGPILTATPGDTVTVNLTNNLPVQTSLVFPGHAIVPLPVKDTINDPVTPAANRPRDRVRSFTTEAAATTGTASYSFTAKAGTYLYETGTNPASQIPMGLYGALVVSPAPPGLQAAPVAAYTVGAPSTITAEQVSYLRDEVLLYSEILARFDAQQNTYVTYNEDVVAGIATTTLDYAPLYYLINGKSFPDTITPAANPPAGTPANLPGIFAPPGQRTLLRLLNASGTSRTPVIAGQYFQVIAEDGYLYNYLKREFAPFLTAGKTFDAMLDLTAVTGPVYYPLYDRRLGLTNAGTSPGGMLTFIGSWDAAQNCSPLKGDANGDGIVNVLDVLLALNAIGGSLPAADVYTDPAVVTPPASGLPCGDGQITISDALLLLNKALGLNPY